MRGIVKQQTHAGTRNSIFINSASPRLRVSNCYHGKEIKSQRNEGCLLRQSDCRLAVDTGRPSWPNGSLMLDPTTVYVLTVIFVATLIRSTLGFGEALVAVPLLALRMPVTIAAPLAVMVSVAVAAVIVVQDFQRIELRIAAGLIFASLFGIPLGVLLLARGNEHVVKTILGAVIIAFSIYALAFRSRLHLKHDHRGWLVGCGFLSGILGGAYGMNGPPLAIYGALRRWSPQHFRATLQGYFLPASLVGLAGYVVLGLCRRGHARLPPLNAACGHRNPFGPSDQPPPERIWISATCLSGTDRNRHDFDRSIADSLSLVELLTYATGTLPMECAVCGQLAAYRAGTEGASRN